MKTLFNSVKNSSLVAMIVVATLFSVNASAAMVNADKGSGRTDIKKVVVTGNANVVLIQGADETVKMEEADLSKVSLKQIGGTLTISSTEISPVTVTVYVKDIYRIDASGKASVQTLGKFNMKNLQVLLKDNATARVKATTESLYTVIDDHAKLELIGKSANHVSKLAGLAKLDTDKFAALTTENVPTFASIATSGSGKQAIVLNK